MERNDNLPEPLLSESSDESVLWSLKDQEDQLLDQSKPRKAKHSGMVDL